jgi:hypothetical protein
MLGTHLRSRLEFPGLRFEFDNDSYKKRGPQEGYIEGEGDMSDS